MPELPEVETVRRGLAPYMEGDAIVRADVNRPDLRWPFPDNMAGRLAGAKVLHLRRRSKYILADLSTGETLLIHLGMSGRMQVSGIKIGDMFYDHPPMEKHDHVVFHMKNGARVTFNDPRRFGAMDLLDTKTADDHALLSKIGPEPLGNAFNEAYLAQALKTKASPIKSALLDQRIVAGLGNIYVCEALYHAGILPTKKAKNIPAKRVGTLVPIIGEVLRTAIDAGGSSLKDHRQTDGQMGYFQHSFQAYGREGQPCLRTGCSGTVKRIVQSGRSTFYCPACQT
ncbi:MAG: bifunctional DNA-formamidopyrimidine glycosylase/DNA-(apurinic or apyrimidinic site) lyase [Planktomarina sp.]